MQNQGLGQSMQFAMQCWDHLAFNTNGFNMRLGYETPLRAMEG